MSDKGSLLREMNEIETRWFSFLSKLEERMKELCEAAIPELQEVYNEDKDEYKRTYHRMLSGIKGQINNIEEKAKTIEEEKVRLPLDDIEEELDNIEDEKLSDFFYDLEERCRKRYQEFEDKAEAWKDKLDSDMFVDYEKVFQSILDEYEKIKDKFCCTQCGHPILIEKIFFTPAFIACPACTTQNTFQPSTLASRLDDVGRLLGEQRAAPVLAAYEREQERERELYHQAHKLEIEKIGFEINKQNDKVKDLDERIAALEAERRESELKAPQIYQEYLKTKFEEWIKLVPEMAEHNRKIYEQWISGYKK